MGRPLSLTPKIRETICASIRSGNFVEVAAVQAGISKDTLYRWLRAGGVANGKIGRREETTKDERALAAFSDAVELAQAESEMILLLLHDQVARGGATKTTTTRRRVPVGVDAQGRTVFDEETVEKTEILMPDAKALQWQLGHLAPKRWGTTKVEITGADGGPIEIVSPLDKLRSEFDRIRAQHRAIDPLLEPVVNGNGHG